MIYYDLPYDLPYDISIIFIYNKNYFFRMKSNICMDDKIKMTYKIQDNKILNIETCKYLQVEWNISNPYENFIYNGEHYNILVSNTVINSLGVITVHDIKLVSLPDMKTICTIISPSYILTKIISISLDKSNILGYFYDIRKNSFMYMITYNISPEHNSAVYAYTKGLIFSEDVYFKQLVFYPNFINDPFDTKNQHCITYSDNHIVDFRLV